MKLKTNYLVIPLVTILVALLGSFFTSQGMDWYDATITRPELTPPKWLFPIAWNLIFLFTTISALIIWNKGKKDRNFKLIIGLFIANAILNLLWSLLFFKLQLIFPALIEMVLLEITNIALLLLTWRVSKPASLLLLPYALWVGFATYLTYLIHLLN